MTPAQQLTTFWDNLMAALEAKLARRPMLVGLVKTVQKIGDQMIPQLAASIPSGLDPKALMDTLFAKIEANITNPMELMALQVVNGLIDGYIGTMTLPTVPTVSA